MEAETWDIELGNESWELGQREMGNVHTRLSICWVALPSAHPRYTERDLTMCESSCSCTGNVRPCVFTSTTTRSTGKLNSFRGARKHAHVHCVPIRLFTETYTCVTCENALPCLTIREHAHTLILQSTMEHMRQARCTRTERDVAIRQSHSFLRSQRAPMFYVFPRP